MNWFVDISYQLLGRWSERDPNRTLPALQLEILKADWSMRAGAYRAALWLATGIASIIGALLGLFFTAVGGAPWFILALLPIALGAFFGGIASLIMPVIMGNASKERAKEIEENLPHGLNYLLALASSGIPPRDIWAGLARAKIFGALAIEAERIVRDLDIFGVDLLTAMRNAEERTPSKRFGEFLVGAVSAFQSGVELENYLRNKEEQFQRAASEEQLKTIDTMALMAETFLVVVVAAPLFLIILLTVMSINQGKTVLLFGWIMVLIFIPLTQIVIGALVRSMNPKVWT